MSITEKYFLASFRNAQFSVLSYNKKSGRQVSVHSTLGTDVVTIDDTAKDQTVFTIEAFVDDGGIGFKEKAKALENAMNTKGEGVLIHPAYGRLTVQPISWEVSSGVESLGMHIYSLTFYLIEAGRVRRSILANTLNRIERATRQVRNDFRNSFVYQYADFTQAVRENVQGVFITALELVRGVENLGGDDLISTINSARAGALALFGSTQSVVEALIKSYDVSRVVDRRGAVNSMVTSDVLRYERGRGEIADLYSEVIIGETLNSMSRLFIDANWGVKDDAIHVLNYMHESILRYKEGTSENINRHLEILDSLKLFLDTDLRDLDILSRTTASRPTAIALSYDFYGTPDRALEIANDNHQINLLEFEGEILRRVRN